jgi:hypothetical protein
MISRSAVLIGDAAFVARPHTAMGVSKAAGDVMALSNCLASEADLPTALQRFEAERIVIGRDIVGYGRQLGASAFDRQPVFIRMTNDPLESSSGSFDVEKSESSVRNLHQAARSVDLRDDGGTFPDCGGYPFGRSGPDIADGEDIRQAGFQRQCVGFHAELSRLGA